MQPYLYPQNIRFAIDGCFASRRCFRKSYAREQTRRAIPTQSSIRYRERL